MVGLTAVLRAILPSPLTMHSPPQRLGCLRAGNSSRKRFAAPGSRSNSGMESPRAPRPQHGDAFHFDPAQLQKWYLPQAMWDLLPAPLQASLTDVQHSGAAVSTGFARLEQHEANIEKHTEGDDQYDVDQLDNLPPAKLSRAFSNASSVFVSDASSCATASSSSASSASQSGSASPVTSSSHPRTRPTFSPVSLGDPASINRKQSRSRDRSFSTPLEPHDAYYATELSHLRTEALPGLRHLARKVDVDWADAKRSGVLNSDDANAFENWWAEKTCEIMALDSIGKYRADAFGLVPTGMGWCAP
ncbi:hypothetical protein BDU57DRAFT_555172 [Ampelomyces quisqualis]|uniref:Uncharacterized protein n=1 Tax=Ampelomyces quisqualis TaxID=50730 RepID=A0A6A5QPE2_AMPQU|nr:hypothetical protein BDU57DRAFT_555172 [Ampelomyces quisqualis]